MMEEPKYDPFYNVRKGGPKEKRIRRVELMGEHQPKPIYYIKSVQSVDDEYLDLDTIKNFYETRIGKVADIYRPLDSMGQPKELALVGFYEPDLVNLAIENSQEENFIEGKYVTVESAKQWFLELYPRDPNALVT